MSKKVEDSKDFESYVDEEPIAPISINKYDPYLTKGHIDDAIALLLEEKKWDENHRVSNLRIAVGLAMIGITSICHAYNYGEPDWKLPKSYNFTFVCVVIYYFFQALYYYVEWYEVGDLFYASNGVPDTNLEKVEFRSKVIRESATYDLTITPFGKGGKKEPEMYVNWNIGDLIDEKGYVHRYLIRDNLDKVVKEFKASLGKKQK